MSVICRDPCSKCGNTFYHLDTYRGMTVSCDSHPPFCGACDDPTGTSWGKFWAGKYVRPAAPKGDKIPGSPYLEPYPERETKVRGGVSIEHRCELCGVMFSHSIAEFSSHRDRSVNIIPDCTKHPRYCHRDCDSAGWGKFCVGEKGPFKGMSPSEEGGMAKSFDCWALAGAALKAGEPKVLFYGPPSTGKSTFPAKMAKEEKRPYYSITLNDESSPSEIWGHWVPVGGGAAWHYGVGAAWWRTPNSVLIINEIDRASGQVLTTLNALLDDPEIANITLYNGETIKPSGGQICVATMNGVPDALPEALQSRFPVTINVNKVNPQALEFLPDELRKVAADSAVLDDIKRRVSLRHFNAFNRLQAKVGAPMAAQMVFKERAGEFLDAVAIGNTP